MQIKRGGKGERADEREGRQGMGWVNLQASMQQFSHTIASQTRLDIEGNHLDIFNANFRHDVSVFVSLFAPSAFSASPATMRPMRVWGVRRDSRRTRV